MYSTGQKPGKGFYKCKNCGRSYKITSSESLPECGNCNNEIYFKYSPNELCIESLNGKRIKRIVIYCLKDGKNKCIFPVRIHGACNEEIFEIKEKLKKAFEETPYFDFEKTQEIEQSELYKLYKNNRESTYSVEFEDGKKGYFKYITINGSCEITVKLDINANKQLLVSKNTTLDINHVKFQQDNGDYCIAAGYEWILKYYDIFPDDEREFQQKYTVCPPHFDNVSKAIMNQVPHIQIYWKIYDDPIEKIESVIDKLDKNIPCLLSLYMNPRFHILPVFGYFDDELFVVDQLNKVKRLTFSLIEEKHNMIKGGHEISWIELK